MDTELITRGCMRGNRAAAHLGYVVLSNKTQYHQRNNDCISAKNNRYKDFRQATEDSPFAVINSLATYDYNKVYLGIEHSVENYFHIINTKYYIYRANSTKAQQILNEFNYVNEFSTQEGLINLYNNLLNILNDEDLSDVFLSFVYKNKINFSSDGYVHILNAFKPTKHKLFNYNLFVKYAFEDMANNVGERRAKQLIKIFS